MAAQTAALDVVRQATGVPESDVDLAEGYRWVTRLSRLALDWIVERSDPLHPRLFTLQDNYRKLLVDNPDVHYLFSVLDDSRSYRLVGYRGECAYLGMTFGTPFGQGQVGGRTGTQTQTHIDEFELGPNGEVDILIAPASKMPDPKPRNAVVLEPGTAQLAIRETYFEKSPERLVAPAHGTGPRAGRGGAAADPLCRGARAEARVRRHVPHLRGRDRPADVARRREQHEHLRGSGRLGARGRPGRRGALALQRRDDLSRRPLPPGTRARRSRSPCTSRTSRSSTGGSRSPRRGWRASTTATRPPHSTTRRPRGRRTGSGGWSSRRRTRGGRRELARYRRPARGLHAGALGAGRRAAPPHGGGRRRWRISPSRSWRGARRRVSRPGSAPPGRANRSRRDR